MLEQLVKTPSLGLFNEIIDAIMNDGARTESVRQMDLEAGQDSVSLVCCSFEVLPEIRANLLDFQMNSL